MTQAISQLEDFLVEEVKANKGSFSPLFSLYKELYEFATRVLPKLPAKPGDNYKINPSSDWVVMRTRISKIPHSNKKLYFRVDYDTRFGTYTALLSDNPSDLAANRQFGELMGAPVRYATLKDVKRELRKRLGIRAWAYICIKSI